MPFTLAHPLAVLPIRALAGARLRVAALVIGSLVPDFEYFATLYPYSSYGHTWPGLFAFCLPIGWLTLWAFDRWGRRGLDAMLPAGWRVPDEARVPWWADALAVWLGAFTHVAWDAFTHVHGAAVAHWPGLQSTVQLGALSVPWYRLLQHGSSILGLVLLAVLVARWARTQPPVAARALVGRIALLGSVLAAVGIANGLRLLDAGATAFLVAGGVAVSAACVAGPIVVGLCLPRAAGTAH
jgi:hypothetical protein